MKTYCNARLAVDSTAHNTDARGRACVVEQWLQAHSDADVLVAARRRKPSSPREDSISVAIALGPEHIRRLNALLDGRLLTFSSLARTIFSK